MDAIEEIIGRAPPPVRELAERLRGRLREWSDGLYEKAQPGWGGIGYHHIRAGYVCGLFPMRDRVDLNFEWGTQLNDPDRLLEGSGTRCRHIALYPEHALPESGIQALLLEAIALRTAHASR